MLEYKYVDNLVNQTFESYINENPFIRIDHDGWIAYSYLAGGNKVGSHSTIIRSHVGRYVAMGCYSFMSRSKTGNYCTFGSRVSIGGSNHTHNLVSSHEIAFRNTAAIYGDTIIESDGYTQNQEDVHQYHVELGHDVWIGDNVVILPGRKIGTGAVIGAGTIVTSDVPPYSIVVGNPSRVVKYRFSEEIIARLLASCWWDKSISDLKGYDFSDPEAFLKKSDHNS
jgi:acetyltransferase-like isoleucine patch superfamily enzyme